MNVAEISLLVKVRDQATAALNKISGTASGFGNKFGSALKIGGLAAAGGLGIAAFALKGMVGEAIEAQKVMAQTDAVLKSTGGASGLTASQINDMAGALSRVTTFEDDTIQAGQNMLLTFTNIGKNVFPQATETILDMSTALGQDLQSSAMQLGKALNDPIAGVTALRRVGVQLTDQQRDQIEVLVKSGDLMGAQKIILKELQVEFGNSARAAGDTFGGKMAILKNQIGEVKEGIGMALLPVLTKLADLAVRYVVPAIQGGVDALSDFVALIQASLSGDLGKAAELFNRLPAPLQRLAIWLAANKDEILHIIAVARQLGEDVLKGLILILKDLTKFFMEHKEMLIVVGIAIAALLIWLYAIPIAIAAILIAIGLLRAHWDEIKAYFQREFPFLYNLAKFFFELIKNQIETTIKIIRDIIVIIMALLRGDWGAAWEGIKQLASDAWNGVVTDITLKLGFMRDIVVFILGVVVGYFRDLGGRILGAVGDLGDVLVNVGKDIMNGLWEGLKEKWEDVAEWLSGIGSKIKNLKGPLDADRRLLLPEARAIMEGFRRGLLGEMPRLEATLGGITAGIPVAARSDRGASAPTFMQAQPTIVNNYIGTVEIHGDPRAGLASLGVPA